MHIWGAVHEGGRRICEAIAFFNISHSFKSAVKVSCPKQTFPKLFSRRYEMLILSMTTDLTLKNL